MRKPFERGNYEGVDRIQHIEDYLAQTYQQETAIVTANSANGYIGLAVFDLAQEVASFFLRLETTASDADGETWGEDAGTIMITPSLQVAEDESLAWIPLTPNVSFLHYAGGAVSPASVGDYINYYALTPRFLGARLWIRQIPVSGPPGTYAGSNHPSVTAMATLHFI